MYTMSQVQVRACTRICIWRMYIIELLSEMVYKLRSEIMDKTIENFLRYVKIDTQSSEESTTIPSTMKQHDLARQLVSELEASTVMSMPQFRHPQAARKLRYLASFPIWIPLRR